jgi:hypothetical protein
MPIMEDHGNVEIEMLKRMHRNQLRRRKTEDWWS